MYKYTILLRINKIWVWEGEEKDGIHENTGNKKLKNIRNTGSFVNM